MTKRITLEERPGRMSICETKMRYAVMLDGKEFSELYFNTRGYLGNLPLKRVDGTFGNLNIGEVAISAVRKEIAQLNRELSDA